jgi:CMP-N-acetylneuraminic acid synthetase
MKIAMIPARMGSQRLKQKNLQEIKGIPLIVHAIRKCIATGIFDEIWVNSEHPKFGEIAQQEGVFFHQRPAELANNTATSEDFVFEFCKLHPCDYLFQVHSIAPLLKAKEVTEFVQTMAASDYDVLLSAVNEQIECAIDGKPINFLFEEKTNSQELRPIQRITWSITGWKPNVFIKAVENGGCATYSGKVGIYAIDRLAGHIIKTKEDLEIAQALYNIRMKQDNKI